MIETVICVSIFDFFEQRIEPFPDAPPQAPPSKLSAFMWHYVKPIWGWFIIVAVLSALSAIIQVSLFGFLGQVVDWLDTADPTTFLEEEYITLVGMAVVILFVLPLLTLVHFLVAHQSIIGNFPMIIRWQAHRYMLGQSFGFYQDEFAGRVATKVMQGALGVREAVMKLTDVFVYVTVYFLGALVLVATFDFWLMLPFLGWFVIYVGMLRYFLPRLKAISQLQSDARSMMTGRIVDSYTNIMTVKLFAHSKREEAYAKDAMGQFLQTVYPQMRYVTQLNTALAIANALLLFSVGGVAIWSWINGVSSIGAVAVGIGLVLRLDGISHWIMWELAGLFENIGMAHDAMQTISKERDVQDCEGATALVTTDGAVQFDHVRFHYGKDAGVLEDFSLDIAAGEKIGLVGRSGAGKSTLMNVLLRLYDLEGGAILIDGQNIADVSQETLRRHIGVVTQDTSLLHRSVRDNIAYSRPDATDDEVIAAAKKANAHEFILGLEDPQGRKGYDAHVGERGVKLSGGQRQRVAIARVILKDAPILVLDEATSALDSEVEAAIQESLFSLMEGKTVIAIAHRLSTISALDRLVVLDKGQIVETGSHDDLIAAGALYASLWQRQSGGFLDLMQVEPNDRSQT